VTVFLALVSSVLIGGSDFIAGVISRQARPLQIAAVAQTTAFVLAIPVAMLVSWEQVTASDAAWSVLSGVAGACGIALFYSAMAGGLISLVVPVAAVVGAVTPVAYAVGSGEHLDSVALVGIVLALAAIAVVTLASEDGQAVSAGTIIRSAAAGCFFGAFIVFISRPSDSAGLWPIVFSRSMSSVGLLTLALAFSFRHPGGIRGIAPVFPACIATGILDLGGTVLLLLALQRGPLAVASVLLALYPLTTVLLAMVVLGERLSRRHVLGVALALTSVILISLH
jgi:drug/metabolite transporter (DMT)-like permease